MTVDQLHNKDMLETEEDFDVAYESYAPGIYRYFFWRTKDVDLSEDLTSNVFEKAWVKRESFERGSVRAWLYKIAHNLLVDHWRVKKDLPLVDDDSVPSQAESVTTTLDKQMTAERLMVAVNNLPQQMRVVVGLRFMKGLPVKQVARLLDLSESNVRVIQYRALKEIRKNWDE